MRRTPVVLTVVLGAVGLWCAPASALIERGQVFSSTFAGEGEHAFTSPSGIAVREETGEVFLVDPAGERVEGFKPNGSGGYEYHSFFNADSPGAIAVDNAADSPSQGDIYVAVTKEKGEEADEREFVQKATSRELNSKGELEKLYRKREFGIEGVKKERRNA